MKRRRRQPRSASGLLLLLVLAGCAIPEEPEKSLEEVWKEESQQACAELGAALAREEAPLNLTWLRDESVEDVESEYRYVLDSDKVIMRKECPGAVGRLERILAKAETQEGCMELRRVLATRDATVIELSYEDLLVSHPDVRSAMTRECAAFVSRLDRILESPTQAEAPGQDPESAPEAPPSYDSGNPPPANICEAQHDHLNAEWDAGRISEAEYDALLNELFDTCYNNLD